MKKFVVFVLGIAGLIITMIIPIMSFGFVSIWIWGPDLMYRSLGPRHPSTWFFIPLAMLISAFVYLALVLLPLFAHFDISLRSRNESDNFLTSLAKETKSLAITYAKLMEEVIGKKA